MFETLPDDEIAKILGTEGEVESVLDVDRAIAKAQRDKTLRDVVEDLRDKADEHLRLREDCNYQSPAWKSNEDYRSMCIVLADEYEAKLGRLDNDKMGNSEA